MMRLGNTTTGGTEMTARYVLSETGHDMHDSATAWEPCNATTLAGAKREATRTLGGGYQHHAIHVGAETGDGRIQTLASKALAPSSPWQDVD